MSNTQYQFHQPLDEIAESILTPAAIEFLLALQLKFVGHVDDVLSARKEVAEQVKAGHQLDFLSETIEIRKADWRIKSTPKDLQDRRVEITGPTNRKMVINALNCGAKVFMADFEDAHSPTWQATVQGQINLRDAIAGKLHFTNSSGKQYRVNEKHAILMARVRGWHLTEKNLDIDGRRMVAALFDFGLYLFSNHQQAIQKNKGLYFYLPKLEHHLEARLWAEVFAFSERYLGLNHGTIKCTVLIETLPAAFQMDEILYELQDYIVALNAGRWDYIFSVIKLNHTNPKFVLGDRINITMDTEFLRAYSQLLIKTCHRRGAHAMGGMAAQIPIKDDPTADQIAKNKVRDDKRREAQDGHDGTWVAHPGLVPIAMSVFDELMPEPNQIEKIHSADQLEISAKDLLSMPQGAITLEGFVLNISASLQYIAAWLSGQGAVPIFNLMEDAATAEISRAQLWQWIHVGSSQLTDGTPITKRLYQTQLSLVLEALKQQKNTNEQHLPVAAKLLDDLVLKQEFADFLTLLAYELID